MKTLHRNLSIIASSLITLGTLFASPAEAITLVFSGSPQNTWKVSLSYDENNITYSTIDGITYGTTPATKLTIEGYIGSYNNSNDYGWWKWSNTGDTINFSKNNFSNPLEPLNIDLWVYPPVPDDANDDAKFGGVGSLILSLQTLGSTNTGGMDFEDGWFVYGGYTFGGLMGFKVPLGSTSVPESSTTTSLVLFGLLSSSTLLLKKKQHS